MAVTFPLSTREPLTREQVLDELVAAERDGEGWLAACEQRGRFLVVTDALTRTLAEVFTTLGDGGGGEVLEVCAGAGALAAALERRGAPIVATDEAPPAGASVETLNAAGALEWYAPAVVLASFAPVDAGVDRQVMRCPSVRRYVVLGARVGGRLGADTLWEEPGWLRKPLPRVAAQMITRHDVWLGPGGGMLHHGEAWLLSRADSRGGAWCGASPAVNHNKRDAGPAAK